MLFSFALGLGLVCKPSEKSAAVVKAAVAPPCVSAPSELGTLQRDGDQLVKKFAARRCKITEVQLSQFGLLSVFSVPHVWLNFQQGVAGTTIC